MLSTPRPSHPLARDNSNNLKNQCFPSPVPFFNITFPSTSYHLNDDNDNDDNPVPDLACALLFFPASPSSPFSLSFTPDQEARD